MTDPAPSAGPPFDPGNPFTPGGPSDMVTAILPDGRQMVATIRIPGTTLTVLLDKRTGERWAANIAETAGMLTETAEPPVSVNGQHGHG